MEADSLIPGLPDDIAISCLIRVPRIHHLSMRAVNCQWRSLLLTPSSTFHTQRTLTGSTDSSLFLLRNSSDHHPSYIDCIEIDLATHKKSKTTFINHSVSQSIFLEGHACISYTALVIILGGFGPAPEHRSSGSLNIFNTLTKEWSRGADMLVGRGEFAWGLIGSRLYVAGGFGGANVGNLMDVEVYDFEADKWQAVSSMPVPIVVDVFFVVSGKLFVRGWVKERRLVRAFSYCPARNVWEDENWMLKVLKTVRPLTLNKFAVSGENNNPPGDKNDLYMVELREAREMRDYETEPVYLQITKFQNETLEWGGVCTILDKVAHNDCECPAFDRDVHFHGLKDRVVVLCHSDDAEDVEVSSVCSEVTKMSVLCPSVWSCAVVDA